MDSSPTRHGPPSSAAAAAAAPVSSCASARQVGLGRPERLAEGAATGLPNACSKARATGWAGTRTATLSSPPRARSQTPPSARARPTRVSGPGQKRSASRRPVSESRTSRASGVQVGHMGDQGIEARAALGLEDTRHRRRIAGMGRQTVDGLRRHQDQVAARERLGGGPDLRSHLAFLAISRSETWTMGSTGAGERKGPSPMPKVRRSRLRVDCIRPTS